jgi:hypothetical protein
MEFTMAGMTIIDFVMLMMVFMYMGGMVGCVLGHRNAKNI